MKESNVIKGTNVMRVMKIIETMKVKAMMKNWKQKATMASLLLCAVFPCAYGQNQSDLEKITASQGGASPLVYTTGNKDIPSINPGTFYNDKECTSRKGLPNFYSKIKKEKEATVAFIGGSITQGEYCYRLQTSQYMEKAFPETRFKWINAGVSGTGTDLGAFRIQEQVLQYKPDLIFIEFAVNGGYPEGMEGMIRQIIKENPATDICLIYTIANGKTVAYQRGDVPIVIKGLEDVAAHYQVSSIHLGMEAAQLEQDGKLLWKGSKENAGTKTLFSNDGVHPITEGGNLYAAAIARGLEKMQKAQREQSPLQAYPLPKPLISSDWDTAGMYLPSQIAQFDKSWKEVPTSSDASLKKFAGWFDTLMTSGKEGASFSFGFEGDMFGLFDLGGPEAGQIEVLVDGQLVQLKTISTQGFHLYEANDRTGGYALNRFNFYCNNRYRGQYDVVKLEKGIHQVTVRISSLKADKKKILGNGRLDDISAYPEKYDQSAIYLGRILLRGKPLSCHPIKGVPKLAQQLKWDQKMERYEKLDSMNPPKKDLILFVGSSTVENWKTVEKDFPGRVVINRGISGSKTIDLINYKDRLITPYHPKQIFIYEGDNDIGYKWEPEEILGQIKKLFSIVRKERPEAEIIFISIKPSIRRMKDKERIEKTNLLVKEFVEKQANAAYADVYNAAFTAKGELCPEHYREDGLHLTAEGYEVWKKVVSKFIK